MKLKIFFSWQTTTETKYNKNFILTCLNKTVKRLKNKPELTGIEFEILEGVNRESGSVQVASTIVDDRIPNCDIFIADLSVVNYINGFKQFIRKITFDKYKPFQNNNVLYEYGVAYNAIGEKKIIGIMNNVFGSPHKNPDNIPFDIKHMRFPIEYKYSSRHNNKEKAQNQLISELTKAIKETALYALKMQRDQYRPLITWGDWEVLTNTTQKYYTNNFIKKLTSQIKGSVNKPNESIRLIGLSGLGKTRILLEAFRVNQSKQSIYLNSRVLYLNCNTYSNPDYEAIFTRVTNENEDRIIILDNCPKSLHRQLLKFITNENNRICLITIDSNPEELEIDKINGVNYISIKKEDLSSIVDQILTEDIEVFGKDNIEKIKEFSQGIPLMAVLIGESIKKGEKFIGKLDDKELLNKLLGEKGQNARYRTILKSCSIFNYFGYEDQYKSQLEFIAKNKNITSLTGDEQVIINEFHEICAHYLKREIFEKKGRLIGLRPFPLAISLAQEWLEPCTPERLINVISSINKLKEPDRKILSEAISEQMKYLGYNDKAKTIVEKIVGPNSPFDNAEVLNSELGSRLFRSFVEVNPVAVSKNLTRVFLNKSKEELLEISEGRRNIIWVLEKLCFDNRTFNEGAKLLYSFAVSENEIWSNNATSQFLQLFKIFLSGTEANLKERLKIIDWGLSKKNKEFYELAIKAMKSGLSYGQFIRSSGAESQGTKRLSDYIPNNSEIIDYWKTILTKLTNIVKNDKLYSDSASDIIAKSIQSVCHSNLGHVIIPFVEDIACYKKNDWDEGYKGLINTKKYERGLLSESLLDKIDSIISSLTKTDFLTRYKRISNLDYSNDDKLLSSEKIKDAIIKLADEFINDDITWKDHFPVFYSFEQIYSYHFGMRIYELIKDSSNKVNEFIETSIKVLEGIEKSERNIRVFIGFISNANPEVKEEFYTSLSKNDELDYLLFHFLSSDPQGKEHFSLLFDLIKNGSCEVSNFVVFRYSNSLSHCNFNELQNFSRKLFKYGTEGYEIIFELFSSLAYSDDKLNTILKPIFKECIFKLGVDIIEKVHFDKYKWSFTICSILSSPDESELAIFINKSIIKSISWKNTYTFDNDIERIYEALIRNHFQEIWKDLSNALLSENDEYIKFYCLKRILGSSIGGVGRSIGVLFDGDLDTIFEWCNFNQPLAPSRIAELVPIFGENNNNFSKWHPIAYRMIDEFGNIEDVLNSLSLNMGNYTWTGSIVPLLEAKKELFKSIENHHFHLVAEWASKYLSSADENIKQEKSKDEEMNL